MIKSLSKKNQLKIIKHFKANKKKLEKECLMLWAEIVKLRTGGKCEFPNCGKKEPHYKIDAHHFYSKGRYKHIKFDLDNGIALCCLHHQAGWGKEAAHSDPNFKDKILGRIQGYKAIRTEQEWELLNRKAQTIQKLDIKLELLYLKQKKEILLSTVS